MTARFAMIVVLAAWWKIQSSILKSVMNSGCLTAHYMKFKMMTVGSVWKLHQRRTENISPRRMPMEKAKELFLKIM